MEFTIEDFLIKKLPPSDIQNLQKLFEDSKEFFELVDGHPPFGHEAEELLRQLPKDKTLDNKFVLGVYKDNYLMGVTDLIKDFPEKNIWFIGLLLFSPEYRNKGLGRKTYQQLKDSLKDENATAIMISVAEQNTKALNFWKKLGFKEIGSKIELHGKKESKFIRLEDSLGV